MPGKSIVVMRYDHDLSIAKSSTWQCLRPQQLLLAGLELPACGGSEFSLFNLNMRLSIFCNDRIFPNSFRIDKLTADLIEKTIGLI